MSSMEAGRVSRGYPLSPLFEHCISPHPAQVPFVRRLLKKWIERKPSDPLRRDDVLLAASELCTNAIRHGHGLITVRARRESDLVVLEVEDEGRWSSPADTDGILAEHGRGLEVVRYICDGDLELEVGAKGTVVRYRRRVSLPASASPPTSIVG